MGRKVYVIGVGMTKFEKPGAKDWDYPDSTFEDKSCIKLIGTDMTRAAAQKVYQESRLGPEEDIDVADGGGRGATIVDGLSFSIGISQSKDPAARR